MNLTDNIRNAFHVVHKTYENINQLMDYCKTVVAEQYNYVSQSNKFLRYKSDNNVSGWYIQNFILLFQNKKDVELENEWLDGPIYVMEIELYDTESEITTTPEFPCVRLSKFEYDGMPEWNKGYSLNDHWRFYDPLRRDDIMNIQKSGEYLNITVKDQEVSDRHYWGVIKITITNFIN